MISGKSTHIDRAGEADPSEILLVDKSKASAKRLRDIEGVQQALDALGSVQNITLTQLGRTRKILFTEGTNDYKILRRFARLIGLQELASGSDLTPFESGGFSSWERVKSLSWGIKNTLGADIKIGAVYDHDFWCEEEVQSTLRDLEKDLVFAHIHSRKEIENYLLVPSVLARALEKSLAEREKRSGEPLPRDESIDAILDTLTLKEKGNIQGQYIGRYLEYHRYNGKDPGTLSTEAIALFEKKWAHISSRMEIIPGKQILKNLRTYVNEKWGVTLTDVKIIDEFRGDEIPLDMNFLLKKLENYRQM